MQFPTAWKNNWFKNLFSNKGFSSSKSDNLVHPCIIDGQQAIVYKKGLRERNPVFYAQLTSFAQENNIFLKEDQRDSFKAVKNDRRSQFMPMMVLGASLLSTSGVASAANKHTNPAQHASSHSVEYQLDHQHHHSSQDELSVRELLDWLYSELAAAGIEGSNLIPNIEKVSNGEMLAIAFGKQLPKAINQQNMQIYGLYNFKNKTVYILDSIDLNTQKGKSILLHELVHYVQYQNGHDERVECKNKLENLAYHLEARYLKQHGQRVSFTDRHVQRVSQCG